MFYRYGVGSTGFGAWRELAALLQGTCFVTSSLSSNFPLLFHWRILENSDQGFSSHLDDDAIAKDVNYWDGCLEIKRRLLALKGAKARLALFYEYFPMDLQTWLSKEIENTKTAKKAVDFVDESLSTINYFLATQKMVHFDAHFRNIVTDGNQLILCDFGLALSSRFDLSQPEIDFLDKHKNYDQAMAAVSILHTVLTHLFSQKTWLLHLKKFLEGDTFALPSFIRPAASRYGAIALIMDDFFYALQKKSKSTPFPKKEIADLLARSRQPYA